MSNRSRAKQSSPASQTTRRGEAGARSMLDEGPEEFRSCTRKKRYASKVEAKKAADVATRRKDAPAVYVYECPHCGGWHLTHRKPRG